MILEKVIVWEPLQISELAADLATEHPGWRMEVVPIVAGCLGTLRKLRNNLNGFGVFTWKKTFPLAKEIQFDVFAQLLGY